MSRLQFGEYVVAGRIGEGSTGIVWLAEHPDIDRKVAVKQLAPALAANPEFRARFRAEARTLASLSHPNVVTIYDYVDDENGPYLVEEWIDGSSLDRVVARAGRLDAPQAIGVLRGALSGLAAAHARGIVHGDVSVHNVLVDGAGTSKLIDFGLSSPSGATGGGSGAPAYASPEAARGDALDARSDVYSAGCVLFELLAGHAPFQAANAAELASVHADAPVPRVPGANAHVADVVTRAMAKNPADRFPDAAAFLAALEPATERDLGAGWLAGASIAAFVVVAGAEAVATTGTTATTASVASNATGRASNIAKFVARHKALVAVGATATAAVVVVAVVASGHSTKKTAAPTGTIDLVATGAHNFHLVGMYTSECSPADVEVRLADFPSAGTTGELSIQPSFGIKGELGGRAVGAFDAQGITVTSNPVGVVLDRDVTESNGVNPTHLKGTIKCTPPAGQAASGPTPTVPALPSGSSMHFVASTLKTVHWSPSPPAFQPTTAQPGYTTTEPWLVQGCKSGGGSCMLQIPSRGSKQATPVEMNYQGGTYRGQGTFPFSMAGGKCATTYTTQLTMTVDASGHLSGTERSTPNLVPANCQYAATTATFKG